ncbi:acylphosphatase [Helicobacter sp. 11S02596-1]|uniref:acylphosphatase n=1 Tax=Helicobacter sp. 11S02596-1 TaxID=1476194 RepID=UPI000BA557AE|nr:acylphosphatase [Helicobacter sp. 11S02596-1]PAF41759.1 hypothetical protein BJI48_07850 [Helicobacter sp. 11S02596-1]
MTKTIKITITGKVQGVGYRKFSKANADTLGITGTSKNLADGSVEIYAQGEQAPLDTFLDLLKTGPQRANVNDLKCEAIAGKHFSHFEILE